MSLSFSTPEMLTKYYYTIQSDDASQKKVNIKDDEKLLAYEWPKGTEI